MIQASISAASTALHTVYTPPAATSASQTEVAPLAATAVSRTESTPTPASTISHTKSAPSKWSKSGGVSTLLSEEQFRLAATAPYFRRVDAARSTQSQYTYSVGDYLRCAGTIVMTHQGWVELRCHLCGGNKNWHGGLVQGTRGMQMHLATHHPESGWIDDRELGELCSVRKVSQTEFENIQAGQEPIEGVMFTTTRKKKS